MATNNSLNVKLQRKRLKGQCTDFKLVSAAGKKLNVHKLVLIAASPYFAISIPELPQDVDTMKLDVDAETLEKVLDFIYLDNYEELTFEDPAEGRRMTHAAKLFQLPKLCDACEVAALKLIRFRRNLEPGLGGKHPGTGTERDVESHFQFLLYDYRQINIWVEFILNDFALNQKAKILLQWVYYDKARRRYYMPELFLKIGVHYLDITVTKELKLTEVLVTTKNQVVLSSIFPSIPLNGVVLPMKMKYRQWFVPEPCMGILYQSHVSPYMALVRTAKKK